MTASVTQPEVGGAQKLSALVDLFGRGRQPLSRKDFQEVAGAAGAFYDSALAFRALFSRRRPSRIPDDSRQAARAVPSAEDTRERPIIAESNRNISTLGPDSPDGQKSHFREMDAFSHALFTL